MTTDIYKH